jgi:hypothetical protein
MAVKYEVCVIESERGWGQKREYAYFDMAEEAIEYRDHINADNTDLIAPDWYMMAEQEIRIVEV